MATYEYDPYGKILTVQGLVNGSLKDVSNDPNHVANANPLRYRGYYYDSETGFYYLQSRYYDPAVCRFINADTYASTGHGFVGHNMFVYCGNDPIDYADTTGTKRACVADLIAADLTKKTSCYNKACKDYGEDMLGGYIDIGVVPENDITSYRYYGIPGVIIYWSIAPNFSDMMISGDDLPTKGSDLEPPSNPKIYSYSALNGKYYLNMYI